MAMHQFSAICQVFVTTTSKTKIMYSMIMSNTTQENGPELEKTETFNQGACSQANGVSS
jgi:hypothetical protein